MRRNSDLRRGNHSEDTAWLLWLLVHQPSLPTRSVTGTTSRGYKPEGLLSRLFCTIADATPVQAELMALAEQRNTMPVVLLQGLSQRLNARYIAVAIQLEFANGSRCKTLTKASAASLA